VRVLEEQRRLLIDRRGAFLNDVPKISGKDGISQIAFEHIMT
jgi:hypothetical protein